MRGKPNGLSGLMEAIQGALARRRARAAERRARRARLAWRQAQRLTARYRIWF